MNRFQYSLSAETWDGGAARKLFLYSDSQRGLACHQEMEVLVPTLDSGLKLILRAALLCEIAHRKERGYQHG